MSWFSKIVKKLSPAAPLIGGALGALAGSEFGFDPGFGGAIGGALGGLGSSLESGTNPFLGAGTGGLEGYFAGPGINSAVGSMFGSPAAPAPGGAAGLGGMFGDFAGGQAGGGTEGFNLDPNGDFLSSLGGAGGAPAGLGGLQGDPVATASGAIGAGGGAGAIPGAIAGAGGAAGAAGAAGAGGASGGLLSMFEKNPALLPALVGGVGAMAGGGETSAEKQIAKQAKASAAGANSLVSSASTGKLPAGAEAAWEQALNDTVTSIQSKYAGLGMSGSTSEAQEISAAKERAAGLKYQMATEATQTGLQALGLSSDLYKTLMQEQLQSDQGLSNSISNFTAALGGGQGTQRQA